MPRRNPKTRGPRTSDAGETIPRLARRRRGCGLAPPALTARRVVVDRVEVDERRHREDDQSQPARPEPHEQRVQAIGLAPDERAATGRRESRWWQPAPRVVIAG